MASILDSTYQKRKTLFWIMNGNVAHSIWIKQEKASFGALSYVKEDLCDDGISDKNRGCNSRGKKLYFPFFFLFSFCLSIISLGPNSGMYFELDREEYHLYIWKGKSYAWEFPLFHLNVNEALNALQGSVSKQKLSSGLIKRGSFRKLEHQMPGLGT